MSQPAEKSRMEYSMRNSAVGMVSKVAAILAGYIARVVFVRVMTTELVGLSGLLTNIINALSLTSLGVEAALVFSLYAPVARGDEEKQASLMALFRRVYYVFAAVVLLFGLILYTLLPMILGEKTQIASLSIICALYVLNSVLSYFCSYRRMAFLSHQCNYVNELFDATSLIVLSTVQCIVLLLTRNFFLYLLIPVVCTVTENLSLSALAGRWYPFLRRFNPPPVEKGERREIMANIRAMLMHKFGLVIISNTDNVLLTWLFGLLAVGSYANYYLITGSVAQVLDRFISGITGSVGDLGVKVDRKHVGEVFRLAFFATAWIYGLAAVSLFILLDNFIAFSFGETYVLGGMLTLVLCMNLYLDGVRKATLIFRDSLGLFRYDRFKTPIEAAVNLGASILLARHLGPVGVFLGTTVSVLLISFWVEPIVLYRGYLKEPVRSYFASYFLYLPAVAFAGAATWYICSFINGVGVVQLLAKLIVCLVLPNAVMALFFHRTAEYRALRERVLSAGKRLQAKRRMRRRK